MTPRILRLLLPAVVLVPVVGCSPSHRLAEVELRDRTVAVVAAIPPHPRVHGGHPGEGAVDPYDPVGSAIRVGTAAAKQREAREAQARLDSVVARIDLAEQIARKVLLDSARRLRFIPENRPEVADFIIDLRIADYGLVADSFEGATFLVVDGEVLLLDPERGVELWRDAIREREVLSGSLFGLPAAAGNIITARALSQLSEQDILRGLDNLADFVANRIVERLRHDYSESRD